MSYAPVVPHLVAAPVKHPPYQDLTAQPTSPNVASLHRHTIFPLPLPLFTAIFTRAGPCLAYCCPNETGLQAQSEAHPDDAQHIGSRDSNHLSYTSSCMRTPLLPGPLSVLLFSADHSACIFPRTWQPCNLYAPDLGLGLRDKKL